MGLCAHEDWAQYGSGTEFFAALYKDARKGPEVKETVAECGNENGEPQGGSGGRKGAVGGTEAEEEETSGEITEQKKEQEEKHAKEEND